jgi:hypothetical protein
MWNGGYRVKTTNADWDRFLKIHGKTYNNISNSFTSNIIDLILWGVDKLIYWAFITAIGVLAFLIMFSK